MVVQLEYHCYSFGPHVYFLLSVVDSRWILLPPRLVLVTPKQQFPWFCPLLVVAKQQFEWFSPTSPHSSLASDIPASHNMSHNMPRNALCRPGGFCNLKFGLDLSLLLCTSPLVMVRVHNEASLIYFGFS